MKYIKLVLDNLDIKPNSEIKGHVTVDYPGAYDGIVINTLIMNSNELIVYKSYNDEKNVPRPDHWSGWILLPKEIEFWLHTDNRIHERLKYSKDNNGNWNKFLLNP